MFPGDHLGAEDDDPLPDDPAVQDLAAAVNEVFSDSLRDAVTDELDAATAHLQHPATVEDSDLEGPTHLVEQVAPGCFVLHLAPPYVLLLIGILTGVVDHLASDQDEAASPVTGGDPAPGDPAAVEAALFLELEASAARAIPLRAAILLLVGDPYAMFSVDQALTLIQATALARRCMVETGISVLMPGLPNEVQETTQSVALDLLGVVQLELTLALDG